jgi:hypothetical protein
MMARFGKSGIIDQEDPAGLGQRFGHRRPVLAGHGRLVPAALADELLQGLLRIGHRAQGGRQAHPARERLNRFAFPLH